MKILVLNCGSSSVKYQLITMTTEGVLAKGQIERIGMRDAVLTHNFDQDKQIKEVKEILNHNQAINLVLETLLHPEYGAIKDKNEIKGVGHRVVHGGDKFSGSVLINDEVKSKIRDCIDLAPLHNPHNFRGINAISNLLPNVPQVASFDTAFHQTIPEHAYLYGLPYSEYLKHGIRRYGFHGTSHRYVSLRTAKILKKHTLKIISCHLGNGCSICAINNGQSLDTSMGFTPLEGLIMGTRCGDIDPYIVIYLASKYSISLSDIDNLLNKHSGLLGISGISNDMREIVKHFEQNDKRAQLAIEIFSYRMKKYIGAYTASLNGVDAIVFTAGIGENSPVIREKVCSNMDYLGIQLDKKKNSTMLNGSEGIISKFESKIKILVVSTNEELVIARDTKKIIEQDYKI